MRVQFSADAGVYFDDALTRLRLLNRFAAVRFMAKVRRQMRRVGQYPHSGNAVPEYGHLPIREFIVDPYRFFYCIDERKRRVLIVAVWHGSQQALEPRLPVPGER